MRKAVRILGVASGFLLSASAAAEPTPVTVRVLAQDAKFIGESMGSARVELRDVETGEVLASGLTSGTTGSTPLIMETHPRQNIKSSEDSAKFTAVLDLDEPRLIELNVSGPLDRPYTQLTATQQRWVMPGEALNQGDGWLIEMPGIAISPEISVEDGKVQVGAFVELMCGCPITPGGRWDANDYRVVASLWRDGAKLEEAELDFVESPGGYAGAVGTNAADSDTIVIFAQNTRTGNSGLANIPLANLTE